MGVKYKIRCELGRLCCFLKGDMVFIPPNAHCDPIFEMDGKGFLNLTIRTPISNIEAHCNVANSYRLEANNIIFPIHTLN